MSGNKHYIMVKTDRKLGSKFKQWCRGQGISMNKAINLLMQKTVKNNCVCKQVIKNGKK
jgi:antitoxin component of RelBE/YafQ-DinJ toxin-antitoxin module